MASVMLAFAFGHSATAAQTCDIADVKGDTALLDTLSRRAAEIVTRAMAPGWNTDDRLSQLVAPDAPSDLGHGDVGGPRGLGTAGVRALTDAMHADTYRFLGWDYMDGRVQPCGLNTVTVEFTDTLGHQVSSIEFVFTGGRLNSAKGWGRSFVSGSLPPH